MRRFILTVLAPLGDMAATACTLMMLNAFAWVLASVCLLPGSLVVKDLAIIYALMVMAAVLIFIVYTVILLGLALRYRVPLTPIFINPDRRAELLQEAETQ